MKNYSIPKYIVPSLLSIAAGCDLTLPNFSFPLPSNPDSELNAGKIRSPRDLLMNPNVKRALGKYVQSTGRSLSQFQMALSPPDIEGVYSAYVQEIFAQPSKPSLLETQVEISPQTSDNTVGLDTFAFLPHPSVPLGNEVIRGGSNSFSIYTVRTLNTGAEAYIILNGHLSPSNHDQTITGEYIMATNDSSIPDRAGTFTLKR